MHNNKLIETLAHEFAIGYIAGSCVSIFDAAEVFKGVLEENGITKDNDEIEDYLLEVLDDEEVFCCENCSWWCPEHDRSEEGTYCSYCSDCEGEE